MEGKEGRKACDKGNLQAATLPFIGALGDGARGKHEVKRNLNVVRNRDCDNKIKAQLSLILRGMLNL